MFSIKQAIYRFGFKKLLPIQFNISENQCSL